MGSTGTNIILPTMKDWSFRNYLTVGGIIFFILFWTILLWMYEPRQLVEYIGVSNGYILTFIIAVIGALTSITTVSIYPMIITMAMGKLSPLPLALIAGAGLCIGDAIFYYLGIELKPYVTNKFKIKLENFMGWVETKPKWLTPLVIYFYIGFTPLPNNLLTGSLAIAGYPFRKIVTPLFLGDITLPLLIVYLAFLGVNLF